jgi:Tetratricopeptide repeat
MANLLGAISGRDPRQEAPQASGPDGSSGIETNGITPRGGASFEHGSGRAHEVGRRTSLGEDHPDYAASLDNLAGLYEATGRHAEAESLLKQS